MRIWQLTKLGKQLARSTNNPDTGAWRIVHFLDRVGGATGDQIADGSRVESGEAAGLLANLRRKGVVGEMGEGQREF